MTIVEFNLFHIDHDMIQCFIIIVILSEIIMFNYLFIIELFVFTK